MMVYESEVKEKDYQQIIPIFVPSFIAP